MATPFDVVKEIFPFVAPTVAAFGVVSVIIIVSSQAKGKRVAIQCLAFATLLAAAVAFLMKSITDLDLIWNAFKVLSDETKFALSIIFITLSYFGAGMYAAGPPSFDEPVNYDLLTPASSDSVVGFDIPATLPKDNLAVFEQTFKTITDEIIADLPTVYEMPQEAVNWVEKMIQYTVAGGKMNRGLSVMDVQQSFAKGRGKKLTVKDRIQSAALGWCIEFLQAFFLVADDVMDDSKTRRGLPCWFRLEDVRLIAVNDSFILESCVYKILKRYFGMEQCYPQLVDLFIEVTRQTELGQLLDLTSQLQGGVIDLTRFTQKRYSSIVIYKTAFYSFYLPVALGMILSGVTDADQYKTAREILLLMGEYFQVADDYLDCYGLPEVIGKIGTDIQDNKCSWLIVQALDRVTPAQRVVLEENYGRHEATNIAAVKAIYHELNMEAVFHVYEEDFNKSFRSLMKSVRGVPPEIFETFFKKIYKRNK